MNTRAVQPSAAAAGSENLLREEVEREQRAQAELAQLAVRTAAEADGFVGTEEIIAAVEAGTLARTDGDDPGRCGRAAGRTASAAAAVHRWRWPLEKLRAVRWDPMGVVIPVLAASPGAGASTVAAAIADAVHASRRSVLLADTADPVRSGLSRAVPVEGTWVHGPHPLVRVRFSKRSGVLVGRVDTELPLLSPGMVPAPPWWRLPGVRHDVTVVDIAHDAWRVAANPLVGAGTWLRLGEPCPRPVLVCRATAPSLIGADAVLSRLDAWAGVGAIAPVEHLVVVGARRWPRTVPGVAGRRLSSLVEHAVFVPYDDDVAAHGVTAQPTPARVQTALRPLLRSLQLPPPGNAPEPDTASSPTPGGADG